MLGWLTCMWAVAALAQDGENSVSTSFSDDFEIRYWQVPGRLPDFPDRPVLNYVEQVNRFTAIVASGPWSAFAQVDEVALFANRYYLDDELITEREMFSTDVFSPLPGDSYVNVEKIRLRYEQSKLIVELGDFYAAFGRGGAFNVNRNVDIDIDSSVTGIKTLFRPGAWDITAAMGYLNRQQVFQDNPNVGLRGDVRHAVGGVRVERFGLGPANIGAHGVVYDFATAEGWGAGISEISDGVDVAVGGATAELFGVGGLDMYFEGNTYSYISDKMDVNGYEDGFGYGLYGSMAAYVGRTTWLLEGKRYDDAERINAVVAGELYEIAIAPTLEYERVITEDSSAALNSNDLYGGRLRVDIAAVPGRVAPYLSYAMFRDLDVYGLHFNSEPETIYHPVGGVEVLYDEWVLLLNGGYRVDLRDGEQWGADRQLHGDVDLKFPLFLGLQGDITSAVEWYRWGVNSENELLQQDPYVESESAITIQKGSAVSVIGYLDYTTNPLVDTVGNISDAVYTAGELQVKPSAAFTIKAFYGSYKAGIRCSGGQCRLMPGFEGARISVAGNF